MHHQGLIPVRFTSSASLIDELERIFLLCPDHVETRQKSSGSDTTEQRLGLAELATLFTLIQGSFFLNDLAKHLYRLLTKAKTPSITLETPTVRVEVRWHKDLTEESIAKNLQPILRIAEGTDA